MSHLRLHREKPATAAIAFVLASCLLLGAVHARVSLGQAEGTSAAPQEVADFFVRLLTAKRVDVKALLGAAPGELPFFRLRLYVGPTVPTTVWPGIDYQLFRDSGGVQKERVELASPKGLFRDRLNTALRDPLSVPTTPGSAGVRIVDVWCQHSGGPGGHVPIMAKVVDGKNLVSGRICHDDQPKLVEAVRLLDAIEQLEQTDPPTLAPAPDAVETLVGAITVHRLDIANFRANARGKPPAVRFEPGVATLELSELQGIPEAMCRLEDSVSRSFESGESFIGLRSDALNGTATIKLHMPFVSGGAAVWAPASITDETAVLEVDASSDGRDWTRLYRLDATKMEDTDRHVLPAAVLQNAGNEVLIRARLSWQDGKAGPGGDRGLRFLASDAPFPSRYRIALEKGVLRILHSDRPESEPRGALRLFVQPESLAADEVSALVKAANADADIYAPCHLDKDACHAIGKYAGSLRFWSPPDWQSVKADWQANMVDGPGWIIFPRLQTLSVETAEAIVAGRKSLSFPEIRDPSCELLATLAKCSGELALDGIETLSLQQSEAIAGYAGPRLSLLGLRTARLAKRPSDSVLRAVVASPGVCTLSGFDELDRETAILLSAGQKHLMLDDVRSLSAPAAGALARMKQGLSLNAVQSLDRATAGELLSFAGESLSLAGLRSVECGMDALPSPDGLRPDGSRMEALSSLLTPSRSPEEVARAQTIADKEARLEELDAMLRSAVALQIESEEGRERIVAAASASDEALKDAVEQIRSNHPQLPPFCKVRIAGTSNTPLDAFVRSPGVFTLQPQRGLVVGKGRFTAAAAEALARGQKHLMLDCLTGQDLTADAAAKLAASSKMVSLDGLGVLDMAAGLPAVLAQYQGPLMSLTGVQQIGVGVEKLFEPLVEDGRASLPAVGMFGIAKYRDFVTDRRKAQVPETPEQKKVFDEFMKGSKPQDWSAVGRGNNVRAKVVLLLPADVEFDVPGVGVRRGPIAMLLKTSRDRLEELAKDARAVAAIRKEDLINDALRSP